MILIDDGKLELKVLSSDGVKEINTVVVYGGILKSKKGINLPNTAVSEPSLTEKDREDLLFGLQNDVDWIALSFVRTSQDIVEIKKIISDFGSNAKVIAKIEKPEALVDIDAIIEYSDALMIARGDLGVEIDMEDVPLAQKMMIRKCNAAAKPVIVATQMMESMITSPRPTRAETNDVAQAVMDGADTVMLSAETASGMYPFEAVKAMVRIIQKIEKDYPAVYEKEYQLHTGSSTFYNESVIASASHLVKDTNAKAFVGVTQSGFTAFRIASHRPKAQIYIFTDNKKLLNKFSLIWGIKAFYYGDIKSHDTNTAINNINEYLKKAGELASGDVVVNTTSMPIGLKSHTNIVKLSIVE
jgi:pyruvate kinase